VDTDKRWACGLSRAMGLVGGFMVMAAAALLIGGVGVALGAPLGQTSDFATPTASSSPRGIAVGPDGNLWFTEWGVNKIGEINPVTHLISEFATPTASSGPSGIAVGPDGNLWFTESNVARVGFVGADAAPAPPPAPATPPVPHLSALAVSPKSFRAASKGASIAKSKRAPAGAKIKFTLDMAAKVTFGVDRAQPGVHSGNNCVKSPKHKPAHVKHCTRYVTLPGSFTVSGVTGANSDKFTGRLGKGKLKPGNYRLSATPSLDGQVGVTATASFKVVR
jgi:DNA-binding beta-propeller fold protein YncE